MKADPSRLHSVPAEQLRSLADIQGVAALMYLITLLPEKAELIKAYGYLFRFADSDVPITAERIQEVIKGIGTVWKEEDSIIKGDDQLSGPLQPVRFSSIGPR